MIGTGSPVEEHTVKHVEDVMTKTVVAVGPDAPFKQIVRSMMENGATALVVVVDGGPLVGIVSEGDLILKEDPDLENGGYLLESRRHRSKRAKAAGLVAKELMTSPVTFVGPEETLGETAHLMHTRGVKQLPVVDREGRVVGLVSRKDLLTVFLRSDEDVRGDVERAISDDTLPIDLSLVRVEVRDGCVRLEGDVELASQVPRAVRRANAVEGVVAVENRLFFRVDDTDRGAAAE